LKRSAGFQTKSKPGNEVRLDDEMVRKGNQYFDRSGYKAGDLIGIALLLFAPLEWMNIN
jgi:hypothetical protein